jgi:hypothetical protein
MNYDSFNRVTVIQSVRNVLAYRDYEYLAVGDTLYN